MDGRQHILLIGFMLALLFIHCEREIEIELPDVKSSLVVEGYIEQNGFANIRLTKSASYFAKVDSAAIADMIILDATVIVSDGIVSDTCLLRFDFSAFPPVSYIGKSIKGVVGQTYYLTVEHALGTATATTTIPSPHGYDSLWFELDANQDSLGYIWVHYSDPPEESNYYRIFTKRLGRDLAFAPILGSVVEDQYFDGLSLDFSIFRGEQSMLDEGSDGAGQGRGEFGYYRLGDTVVVRTCAIDKAHFDFWRTYEQEIFSGGPFASPKPIQYNINGGIGIWGGYGAVYDTLALQ